MTIKTNQFNLLQFKALTLSVSTDLIYNYSHWNWVTEAESYEAEKANVLKRLTWTGKKVSLKWIIAPNSQSLSTFFSVPLFFDCLGVCVCVSALRSETLTWHWHHSQLSIGNTSVNTSAINQVILDKFHWESKSATHHSVCTHTRTALHTNYHTYIQTVHTHTLAHTNCISLSHTHTHPLNVDSHWLVGVIGDAS